MSQSNHPSPAQESQPNPSQERDDGNAPGNRQHDDAPDSGQVDDRGSSGDGSRGGSSGGQRSNAGGTYGDWRPTDEKGRQKAEPGSDFSNPAGTDGGPGVAGDTEDSKTFGAGARSGGATPTSRSGASSPASNGGVDNSGSSTSSQPSTAPSGIGSKGGK